MERKDRITEDPAVCHGSACVTGTRVLVATLLDNLACGVPEDEILASYPSVSAIDLKAAVAYAADLARGRLVVRFPWHGTRVSRGRAWAGCPCYFFSNWREPEEKAEEWIFIPLPPIPLPVSFVNAEAMAGYLRRRW